MDAGNHGAKYFSLNATAPQLGDDFLHLLTPCMASRLVGVEVSVCIVKVHRPSTQAIGQQPQAIGQPRLRALDFINRALAMIVATLARHGPPSMMNDARGGEALAALRHPVFSLPCCPGLGDV